MNVSRETLSGPAVRPLLFRKYLREANSAGLKDTTRRVMTEQNTQVQPGTFDGVFFETGRVRPNQPRAELRAQCRFGSGRVRVVSIFPVVRPGDLFWVKSGRFGSRVSSAQTIEVRRIRVARLQDMTSEDYAREGVCDLLPPKLFGDGEPRNAFARLWSDINGAGSWAANPWVWIYEYRTFDQNIDDLLASRK
jgi:hypothetical protein